MTDDGWKGDFFKILGASTIRVEDVEQALAIRDANLPPMLYRYRSPPSKPGHFEALESRVVELKAPNSFNDPFDSAAMVSVTTVRKALALRDFDRIARVARERGLTPQQIEAIRGSDDPYLAMVETRAGPPNDITPEQATPLADLVRRQYGELEREPVRNFV